MYRDKKVVVVMPAYNAAKTLRQTYAEVRDQQIVDTIILVDDGSRDDTVAVARGLEGVLVYVHEVNKGYGGIRRPATARPWTRGRTSSLCSTPTISTRLS